MNIKTTRYSNSTIRITTGRTDVHCGTPFWLTAGTKADAVVAVAIRARMIFIVNFRNTETSSCIYVYTHGNATTWCEVDDVSVDGCHSKRCQKAKGWSVWILDRESGVPVWHVWRTYSGDNRRNTLLSLLTWHNNRDRILKNIICKSYYI